MSEGSRSEQKWRRSRQFLRVKMILENEVTDHTCTKPQSAKDFFAATIIEKCRFVAWKCESKSWKAFSWAERGLKDTCSYGDPKGANWKVGEYIDRDSTPNGNYLVFFTQDFNYCSDQDCKKASKNCNGGAPAT